MKWGGQVHRPLDPHLKARAVENMAGDVPLLYPWIEPQEWRYGTR